MIKTLIAYHFTIPKGTGMHNSVTLEQNNGVGRDQSIINTLNKVNNSSESSWKKLAIQMYKIDSLTVIFFINSGLTKL